MKTRLRSRSNQGNALLFTCLGAALVIGITLASYLSLMQAENKAAQRSQVWNSSMVLAEAGVEEGMALINKFAGTGTSLINWPNSATTDGWTQTSNAFHLTRNIGSGYYSVYVTNVNINLAIVKSTGTVLWTNGPVTAISRSVLVNAGTSTPFEGAILAKNGVTLSGGATVDSFNSQNTNYSNNGLYDPSRHEANGSIMTDASNVVMTPLINMSGNAHVYGHVFTGPGDTISYSGNATVGDTNFAGPGIESGWSSGTANILIPAAPIMPTVSWLPMPPMAPVLGTNTYTFAGLGVGTTNYYQIPSSFGNLSSHDKILISGPGVVALDVEGNFQMSGQSSIVVGSNASLVAWFNGDPQLSGGGTINQSGNATNITFYGTANCTSIQYSGGSSFIGTIYAPYADVNWSGSTAVSGSVVANSFTDSGGANIHYDEGLQGQYGSYVASSWAEVP